MAWEHFTDWLSPGDIITQAMHKELYEAAIERSLAAKADDLGVSLLEELKDSSILTLSGATPSLTGRRLIIYLNALSSSYHNAGIEQAIEDLGPPLNFPRDISIDGKGIVPSHYAYNLARRMIQRLRSVRIGNSEDTYKPTDSPFNYVVEQKRKRKGLILSSASAWSEIATAFANEPDGNPAQVFSEIRARRYSTADDVTLGGSAFDMTFSIPKIPIYEERSARLWAEVETSGDPVSDDFVTKGDYVSASDVTANGTHEATITAGILSSEIEIRGTLGAYVYAANGMAYEPPLNPDESLRKTFSFYLHVEPTFRHPYEPM